MRIRLNNVGIILLLLSFSLKAQVMPNLGGQRKATSSAQFLKIGVGARAEAMGQSYVAIANDAAALFWNPAGLVQFESNQAFFSRTMWVVDIQIENAGLVWHFGDRHAVGLSFTYLHTEDMEETTVFQPFGTGRYFTYSDAVVGASYAMKMTEQFSFGLTLKYVQETIAEFEMRSVMFDLGTYYWTGFANTRIAVSLSNFGPDLTPEGSYRLKNLDNEYETIDQFQSFAPPTMFRFGVANDFEISEANMLTASIQLNHPNDNTENLNFGLEYAWNNLAFIRGGYQTAHLEQDFSLGLGLQQDLKYTKISLDYAYTDFGRLGTVNRFNILMEF